MNIFIFAARNIWCGLLSCPFFENENSIPAVCPFRSRRPSQRDSSSQNCAPWTVVWGLWNLVAGAPQWCFVSFPAMEGQPRSFHPTWLENLRQKNIPVSPVSGRCSEGSQLVWVYHPLNDSKIEVPAAPNMSRRSYVLVPRCSWWCPIFLVIFAGKILTFY